MATKLAAAYNSFHVFPSSATLDGKFEVFPFMTACQSKGKTTKQAALLTKGETETCPNISWTDICISAGPAKFWGRSKPACFTGIVEWLRQGSNPLVLFSVFTGARFVWKNKKTCSCIWFAWTPWQSGQSSNTKSIFWRNPTLNFHWPVPETQRRGADKRI